MALARIIKGLIELWTWARVRGFEHAVQGRQGECRDCGQHQLGCMDRPLARWLIVVAIYLASWLAAGHTIALTLHAWGPLNCAHGGLRTSQWLCLHGPRLP